MANELFPDDEADPADPDRDLIDVLRLNLVPGLGPRT